MDYNQVDSVVSIGPAAFRDCDAATIYYAGSVEQWKSIRRNQPGIDPQVNPVDNVKSIKVNTPHWEELRKEVPPKAFCKVNRM